MTDSFDVSDHVTFLQGYLDAVGRVISTDTIFAALGARLLIGEDDLEQNLRALDRRRLAEPGGTLENTVERVLGLKAGRLSFYLVEYILWFLEFVPDAELWQLDRSTDDSDKLTSAYFLVKFKDQPSVAIYMYTADRSILCQDDGVS